ncbi:hypothetical protein OSB04_008886 [Centaurea solstitialis]|uniref:DNL-type domain-containing protein n=1 Tax=Centaurea solstitialis TaxID=347529 RepID=A0AA38TY54_9ASTR|nr:hypothetical protein OSB04_008886 [Centaurea solstitialis]
MHMANDQKSYSSKSEGNDESLTVQNLRNVVCHGHVAASVFSLSSLQTTLQPHRPTVLPCPNFTPSNLTLKFPRLGISHTKRKHQNRCFPYVISCWLKIILKRIRNRKDPLLLMNQLLCSFPTMRHLLLFWLCYFGTESRFDLGATIDLKLPRRSLLVHFTCNACGERSQKLINRLAYEKGTVFVQCTGCSKYHKLVDNLNLVVEYDFREEPSMSSIQIKFDAPFSLLCKLYPNFASSDTFSRNLESYSIWKV